MPYLGKSLLHYHPVGNHITWKDNVVFQATMRLIGTTSGRSAKYVHVEDIITNATYPMFLTDLCDLAANSLIDHGVVTDRWVVQKRGNNYGIRRARSDES